MGLELSSRNNKIKRSITEIVSIILYTFILPISFFLLIFMGTFQDRYPYESNFSADLNNSFETASLAVTSSVEQISSSISSFFYKIYNIGNQNPNWFYYFFIILCATIYFTISRIIRSVRHIWKSSDGASARNATDYIDNNEKHKFSQTYLKGGNKYIK